MIESTEPNPTKECSGTAPTALVTESIRERDTDRTNESQVNDEVSQQYLAALREYEEGLEEVKKFRVELKDLFHKSQDTFEKQLSFISAGALGLSVGFIKDIVHPIKGSAYKWMLLLGWGLLITTLLLNLVSHIIAARNANKGAKEAEDIERTYNPAKIDKRARRMEFINWVTVATLAGGIIFIVCYITLNAIL